MAIPDWHDDDTDDEDDVLLGVVVSPAARSPRRLSGTATRDRSASSLVSTLGNAAGLYGGSVLGFHERNAGTTAFSPFSPIARTAGGAPTPGPGRISLAGGGSPRVARLRLDDGDEDGDSTGGRLDGGGNEGDAGERGDRGARASPSGLPPGPSRGLGIGGARASIPPRSPSAAWPPEARLHLAPGDPSDLVGVDGVAVDADPAALAYGDAGLRAVSLARNIKHQRAASRRAAAAQRARVRQEALELELGWALEQEQSANADLARFAGELARSIAREDAEAAHEAEREEQRQLDEMDARWRARDAAVRAVLAADAAESERLRLAAEEAESAAKRAEEEKKRADEAAAAAKKAADEAKAKKEREDAEAKAKKEREDAAAEAARRAEEERRTGVVTGQRLPSGSVPKIQVAAEASKQEGELAKLLAEARAKVAEYSTAPAAKRERRVINNNITVHVQQIAATRQQIEKKAVDIAQFLNGFQAGSIQRVFATISLAKRVLTQCDSQVSKLNRFAFALAEVSVRVAVFDATFGQVLIALLHEACVLAVPKYYPFVQGRYASDDEYFKLMGYVAAEEQPNDLPEGAPPKLETTDNFCRRIQGFMLFYAAYTQCDNPRHPHGINHAWAWASRLVNRVPPNRFSATALESFTKHAGFALWSAYGAQFGKILDVVDREFLPTLEAKDDADSRPVVSRMRTYLNERGFLRAPEGREMPNTDTSSNTRL